MLSRWDGSVERERSHLFPPLHNQLHTDYTTSTRHAWCGGDTGCRNGLRSVTLFRDLPARQFLGKNIKKE